jgi:phosphoribosylformylglycinamidine synthase
MQLGLIRASHDLSEGGLAVALAEMAFGGGLGLEIDLPKQDALSPTEYLFSESNSRFVIEVAPGDRARLLEIMGETSLVRLGTVASHEQFVVRHQQQTLCELPWTKLKQAWLQPLNWS